MEITERMENPKIGIFKAPFSSTVNHYGILFKANALILMDEAAFTTAARTIKIKVMKEENSTYISPLLSFDLYLEAYHHLIKNLKKETDIKQLKYILKGNIGLSIQDMLRQEVYDALVLTSFDQHIIWVNNGFTEMTGYAKNYALGKKPTFLQGEQTSKSKIKDIGEQLHRKHGYTGSIVNYRKSGESYVCQIKILPLYDSKKELTHFIALERELLSA